MDKQTFTQTYGPFANDISGKTGLDPGVVLGVIGQETGWGDHVVGNNLFGVMPGGKLTQYRDIPTAGQGFVDLINSRYAGVGKLPPEQQAQGLVARGYNTTDPNYATSVNSRANTVRQAGFGAPSADEMFKQLQTDRTQSQQPVENAPSSDDVFKQLQTDGMGTNTSGATVNPGPLPTSGMAPTQAAAPQQVQANTQAADASIPNPANRTAPVMPNTLADAGGAIANAASEGFNSTNVPLLNSLGAIYRGAQQTGIQVGKAIAGNQGEQAASDIVSIPEAYAGGVRTPGMQAAAERFGIFKKMYEPGTPSPPNPLDAVGPEARAGTPGVGPSSFNPATQPAPAPSAAGAAPTPSTAVPAMTAVERATAENKQVAQTAVDRAGPGGLDPTEYIPGEQPTRGSVHFNGTNQLDEKTLQGTNPEFAQNLAKRKQDLNTGRVDYMNTQAGDPIALDAAEKVRDAQKDHDLGIAFGNKTDVATDAAQGFVDQIDKMLNGPAGKEDAVVGPLQKVRDSMYDRAGNLETDPEMLYGVRKNLTNMLGKAAKAEQPTLQYAANQLATLKDSLDGIIEQGAPGFKTYRQNYAQLSQPIDTMETLQNFVTGPSKITNSSGVVEFARVQRMVEKLVRDRQADGVNPAKSIPDATMDKLFNLRNTMAREQLNTQLAKMPGSDTVQQATNAARLSSGPLGVAIRGAGDLLAHAAIAKTTLGLGNVVYSRVIKPGLDAARANKAAKAAAARGQELLSSHPEFEGPKY